MPAFTASAPGKIILFGEHAVVYGQPAIAIPVNQVRARAIIQANPTAQKSLIRIQAPDIGLDHLIDQLPANDPLRAAVLAVFKALAIQYPPAFSLQIRSQIPVASGLGSGAAVSAAVIRALAGFLGQPLTDEQVSALAYEVEKIHHGTPSGIDNTVVSFGKPVFFRRGQTIEIFEIQHPFTILIGNTGIASLTRESVADVRRGWQAQPEHYERLFSAVGEIASAAREVIEAGQPDRLGPMMDQNHTLLQAMGVSSPELDHLVQTAKQAGALGAKLSGGGRGGNMIALVQDDQAQAVAHALQTTGATQTIITQVGR